MIIYQFRKKMKLSFAESTQASGLHMYTASADDICSKNISNSWDHGDSTRANHAFKLKFMDY
jgi:hypothetical protein